jgi:hypothetical protein
MSYEIIDNFLGEEEFAKIQSTMLSSNFPWYLNHSVTFNCPTHEQDSVMNYQFTHTFYTDSRPNSEHYILLQPLLKKLDPAAIVRIKANLIPVTADRIVYDFHRDFGTIINCKTAVFYINNNNGVTIFKDGGEVESVGNRFISFDSNMLHTGTSCTDKKVRCVININYFEKNKE